MVVKADQERVKTLLKDTITLLCRNGLAFKSKFCIEALIGVTLDDDDVFLISINELIKNEQAKEKDSESEPDNVHSHPNGETRKRKRRKRTRVKTESGSEAGSSGGESEESGDGPPSPIASQVGDASSTQSLSEPAAKRPNNQSVKQEAEEEESEEEDLVFIKEEPHDSSWQQHQQQQQQPQSTNMYSNISATSNSGFGEDQNFSSLSDMSLVPVGSQEEGAMWAQTTQMTSQMQQVAYRPRGPRTSTVTSEGQGDGQTPGQPGQDTSQVGLPLIPSSVNNRARPDPTFITVFVHLHDLSNAISKYVQN